MEDSVDKLYFNFGMTIRHNRTVKLFAVHPQCLKTAVQSQEVQTLLHCEHIINTY